MLKQISFWTTGVFLVWAQLPAAAQDPPPLGAQFQVNVLTGSQQVQPAIAVDPQGGFVVVWESYTSGGSSDIGIQARSLDGLGFPDGNERLINASPFGVQRRPATDFLADGRSLVIWESFENLDDPDDGLQGRLFGANEQPLTDDFAINSIITLRQIQPSVAARSDGGFVVTWASDVSAGTDQSGLGIQARLFDSAGIPLGVDFQVNSFTTSVQHEPEVAALANDEFVVVWESLLSPSGPGSTVSGQLFDSLGAALGSEFEINSYVTGIDQQPFVAADPEGGFVVVWQSLGSSVPDDGFGIEGRRFDSQGSPVGAAFQVNQQTPGQQKFPHLAVAEDGGFVVTWEHDLVLDQEVRGRQFDSAGVPLGGDFRVDTLAGIASSKPLVAVAPDGGFVVAWQSYGSAETDTLGHSIQARAFPNLQIFSDGFESGDTAVWSSVVGE